MSIPQKLIELVRVSNPYHYLGPVPAREFFFDREEELQTASVVLKQILNGGMGGVLVQGGRGSGKTSFLVELQRRLNSDSIANAYIPLDPEMVKEGSESLLFSTVLQELIRSSCEAKIIEQSISTRFVGFLRNIGSIENVEIDFPGFNLIVKPPTAKEQFSFIVLRDGLTDFLKLISTRGKKGACMGAVVLLDEGDALTQNEKLLHVLRNAFQEIRKVGLVIAGSTKLSDQVGDVFSPVPRFFRKIELGPYPNDDVVTEAISKPLTWCSRNLLLNHATRLEIRHTGFDRRLMEVVARNPMHINMLCNFSFDLGAKELRQDQGTTFILRMNFTREVLEEAITQLRGTKNYSDFIESLDSNEEDYLKILSKSPIKLSIKEATIMLVLDELEDQLQALPAEDICKQMCNCETILPTVTAAVNSLLEKAVKYDITLFASDIVKKKFEIEDNWIKAYFRYSEQGFNFNIEFTSVPFIGVSFFGDCVSSIFLSIFFARLTKFMDTSDKSHVHEGPNPGDGLVPWRNRKLLMIVFKKTDDLKYHHIAFNLRAEANTIPIKIEIEKIARCLRELNLISDFVVKEPSTVVAR